MSYNLTEGQKELLKWIVAEVRAGRLQEEFRVSWYDQGAFLMEYSGNKGEIPDFTKGVLTALASQGLLHCESHSKMLQSGSVYESSRTCILTGRAYEAVDADFNAPDTSFVRHLTPLAEISGYDEEIAKRCFPILGAGSADPVLWDSALRTCSVILEERLRDVGGVADPHKTGSALVNDVFGDHGTLAQKFAVSAERRGYRDLYAGIMGVFRNPTAHRLVDPAPQEAGAVIAFVNLLLRRLEDLR